MSQNKYVIFIKKIIIVIFWLAVWQIMAMCVDNFLLIATPVQALRALMVLITQGEFWRSVFSSLWRIAVGFLLGVIVALFLAAISSRYRIVEEVLRPFMVFCKSVPVAVFAVLLLIWWGSGMLAVAICFLVVFPNIYLNTLEGLKSADRELLEMAEVFRLPFSTRFFYIYRPALKPFLLSAFQLSLGMCWKSGVAAEVIGTPAHSIGGALYLAKIYLDTADLFAWAAVIVLLSVIFEKTVFFCLEAFFRWEPACRCPNMARGDRQKNAVRRNADRESLLQKYNDFMCDEQEIDDEKQPAFLANTGNEQQILRVHDLGKSYHDRWVFRHVTTEFHSGTPYLLDTPSGSGKTTFFRCLCGLEQPQEGEISGIDTFAVQFQEDRLCEDYSAVKNLEMVLGDVTQAQTALAKVLPEEALDIPCRELSGGMKRRVALVRAMEAEAQCVLLDEPFTGLDEENRKKAQDYIREKTGERILLMATHIRPQEGTV